MVTTTNRLELLLRAALESVREAGERIEAVRAGSFAVEQKGAAGPVTTADREADAMLRERLLRLQPAAWLSEETADDLDRLGAERVWIVDPLDGTREFVEGVPEYAVAVALVERGEPILGIVYHPPTRTAFWALRGGGAFRDGEPIRVREGDRLLASRSELRRGEFAPFEGAWRIDPVGSIEYKLALIAAGDGAVTLSRGPKHEWDVCAGALLVTEAGGAVTDLFGAPFRFNRRFPKVKGILAGAPESCARAAALLAAVGPSARMDELL